MNNTRLGKKTIITILFIILISLISSQLAFGYTADFEERETRLIHPPILCAYEPNDSRIDEKIKQFWMKEVKNSVNDWKVKLQSKATQYRENWNIEYVQFPPMQVEIINFEKCDFVLLFKTKPPPEKRWLGVEKDAGNGKSIIEIYYLQRGICSSSEGYDYYCFNENEWRIISQLATTIRHEIGHALGLGHYLSDDPVVNSKWSKGITFAPSIMVEFHYGFEDLQEIMSKDINELHSMYGLNGFGEPKKFETVVNPPIEIIPPSSIITNSDTKLFLNVSPTNIQEGNWFTISGFLGSGSSKAKLPQDFSPVINSRISFNFEGIDSGYVTTNSFGKFEIGFTAQEISCESCKTQDFRFSAHYPGSSYLDETSSSLVIRITANPNNSGKLSESEFKSPLDRVTATFARVQNAFDKSFEDHSVNDHLQIKTNLKNNQNREQTFAYVVLIKDERGTGHWYIVHAK